MKKNGYTVVELLTVIVIMGVALIFVINKTSYAFKDTSNEFVENENTLLLRQAKEYGKKSEKLKEDGEMIVMVSDLVEEEFLVGEDGIYYNYEGKDINDTKIKLTIDEDENIEASFLD